MKTIKNKFVIFNYFIVQFSFYKRICMISKKIKNIYYRNCFLLLGYVSIWICAYIYLFIYVHKYVCMYNINQNLSSPSIHFFFKCLAFWENKIIKIFFLIFYKVIYLLLKTYTHKKFKIELKKLKLIIKSQM